MPVISRFYGISIMIFFKDHNPPHFHAKYEGQVAVFDIKSRRVLAGDLPLHATRRVKDGSSWWSLCVGGKWNDANSGEGGVRPSVLNFVFIFEELILPGVSPSWILSFFLPVKLLSWLSLNCFKARSVSYAGGILFWIEGWASARSAAGRRDVGGGVRNCSWGLGGGRIRITFMGGMSMWKRGGWRIQAIPGLDGAKRGLWYKPR